MMEGEGSSESEYTEIVSNAESLDNSTVFHVTKDVLGFILYMHQQIPSILQDINAEFDMLRTEYGDLEAGLAETEVKASFRRVQIGRMREVKRGIKRVEKLVNTVHRVESALKLGISEVGAVERLILVLGASPIRPQCVYELCFLQPSNGNVVVTDFAKSKAAEGLSRKAIRALLTSGAGSGTYPGPSKLFLLIKAPSSFNMPLHFLPKRDFRYSKKIVPLRLRLKCRSPDWEQDAANCTSQIGSSNNFNQSDSKDLIWFQCRHVVKGLAFNVPTEE